jgi:threonine dehydratase
MVLPAPAAALPSLAEVDQARERIAADVHWTPLLSSRTLGALSQSSVWLKCENLQRTGSFKIRGALNALQRARELGRLPAAGVLTYSSGNHGQALALAARIVGCKAIVVVPEDIAEVKRAAIEGYGSEVVSCGLTSIDRYERALGIAQATGALIVPPFDDADIIAGQGTTGLEIVEDLPEVDAILVPTGGGGLVSGIAIAVTARNPSIRVFGVEPESANALYLSMAAGEIVKLSHVPRTIADGLRPSAPGALTFAAARRYVERFLLVDDEAILRAQRLLLERAKLFVEPSGAAAVAALLEHRHELRGLRVVAVLSGGNAAPPRWL